MTTKRILQIATICLFFGRGWEHLFVDAPYRSFFWNERFWQPIIEGVFNQDWGEYVRSPELLNFINNWQFVVGCLFMLFAFLVAIIPTQKKVHKYFTVPVGFVLMLFLMLLIWAEKFYTLPMLLEQSTQLTVPLIWFWAQYEKRRFPFLVAFAKWIIAFTFVGHGIFALGILPRPGHFVQMFIDTLGVTEGTAVNLLNLAGIADFAVALSFLFSSKISRIGLMYAIFWGVMTTFARLWANVYWDFLGQSLMQWLGPFLYRVPHFLLPLVTLIWESKRRQ